MNGKPSGAVSAIAAVLIAAVVGVAYVLKYRTELESHVGVGFTKTIFEFLLVTALGGGLALLYKHHVMGQEIARQKQQRDGERRENELQLIRDARAVLIGCYSRAKRVRRLLRATAITQGAQPDVLPIPYEKQMSELLDVQLELETMAHELTGDRNRLQLSEDARHGVDEMEAYLRALLREYESAFPATGTLHLASLPVLAEFVGPYSDARDFRGRFVHQFHAVLDELTDQLLA